MKILHVIPSVASVRGGPSHAVIETVKALRDSGIKAEIATTNDNGNDLLNVPLCKCVEYQQVPVWFFPRFSPNVHSIREFAFSTQFTIWLWRNACRYDLLHIHAIFSYTSTTAMIIARSQGIPYIVRPLGQLCEWSLQQGARKKQLYLRLIERANLNHSQALHLTSKQEQQEIAHLNLSTPSFILPHGISIPPSISDARSRLRRTHNIPADEPIILFLSRLHPKKGLDYLIPALGKLADHHFTFVIAGSGSPEYEAEIKTMLDSFGILDRTHFAGFVEGETKNVLMQGSDLFVLPSHSENFAVVVLEALAAGKPVLVTPGVALASIVQRYQLGYVVELDVTAIASAINHYFDHVHGVRDMSNRAYQLVLKKYTWNRIIENLTQIYSSVLKKTQQSFNSSFTFDSSE